MYVGVLRSGAEGTRPCGRLCSPRFHRGELRVHVPKKRAPPPLPPPIPDPLPHAYPPAHIDHTIPTHRLPDWGGLDMGRIRRKGAEIKINMHCWGHFPGGLPGFPGSFGTRGKFRGPRLICVCCGRFSSIHQREASGHALPGWARFWPAGHGLFAMAGLEASTCGSVPAIIAPEWTNIGPIALAAKDLLHDDSGVQYLVLSKRSVALCKFILGDALRQDKA